MEEKILLDIEKQIGELWGSTKSAHNRIDDLQLVTKAFYDLASDVKVMVGEMSGMKKDIAEIKSDINTYHVDAPNKLIFNAKNATLLGVISALVSAIITLVLK